MIPVLYTTYNRLEYTKQTLPRLFEATPEGLIHIVDNGSTDGTVEWLEAWLTTARNFVLHIFPQNMGISAAMNWFFNKNPSHSWVAKVDNDTSVPDGWLSKLIKAAQEGGADVVQAAHYFLISRCKDWTELEHWGSLVDVSDGKLVFYPYVGGSGIVIKRQIIDEFIGGEGLIFGWGEYLKRKPMIRTAFFSGVWVDLLDMEYFNKYREETDKLYYGITGRMSLQEARMANNR